MQRQPHPPVELYEGLIFKHAIRVVHLLDDDLDDVRQFYRLKAWRALLAYEPARFPAHSGETPARRRDRYVFMCLVNAEKDLVKRSRTDAVQRRRSLVSLEALPEYRREVATGVATHEAVFCDVEDEPLDLPNTLSGLEMRTVILLTRGYSQREAARRLSIDRKRMERVMRDVRAKLGDWRPDVPDVPAPAPSVEPPLATAVAA